MDASARSKRRFVLTGTFSSFNKGDAAMEICATEQLKSRFPGADVSISTPFPDIDRPFYREASVVRSLRRRLVRGSLQVATALIWRICRDRFAVNLEPLVRDEETQAFIDADAVIDLSGDMLTEDYGPHVAYSHFLPLLLALALDKPLYVCAQSIGPFKLTRPLARFVLNQADTVTARDEITERYLAELGIQPALTRLTADLAFLLTPSLPDRVDAISEGEGIDWGRGPWLGVSLSQLVETKYEKKNSHAANEDFATMISGALDSIVDELDVNLVFVPHVTGPRREHDDRLIARAVKARLRHGERAVVVTGDYRPDELKGLIARCQAFLGARMHANIAALSSAVPTVAIAYSHKAPGIMALFEQSERVLDIATLTRAAIIEAVGKTFRSREAVSATLAARLAPIRARSLENVNLLGTLLQATPK